MQAPKGIHGFQRAMTTVLLFVLFCEWLRPLTEISYMTGLYILSPFYIAVGWFVVCDYLRIPPGIGWPLKIGVAVLVTVRLFYGPQVFDFEHWALLGETILGDVKSVVGGQFMRISGQTRTIAFLIGWALMASVVESVVHSAKRSHWFTAATLVYLITIQLGFGADTNAGIVRALAAGLMLGAVIRLPHIEQQWGTRLSFSARTAAWVASALFIVVVSTVAGQASAHFQPGMMEPVRWFEDIRPGLVASGANIRANAALLEYADLAERHAIGRSGYGDQDLVLGLPLTRDDTILFTAVTEQLTYWRGETKNYYNGNGWEQRRNDLFRGLEAAGSSPVGRTIKQKVLLRGSFPGMPLVAGGTIYKVEAMMTDKGKPISLDHLQFDRAADKYSLDQSGVQLSYYQMEVELPVTDSTIIREQAGNNDPIAITANYLQLQQGLPKRIGALASKITKGYDTRYDKAKAVETYLRAHFEYSLSEPSMPGEREDFVDRFLFADQKGYCDHFSTAMVVLLRSAGIPARWAKGFAPGDAAADGLPEDGRTGDARDTSSVRVTIRGLHAHSWPEVYFPQVGWVPFEPTPNYQTGIIQAGGSGEALALRPDSGADSMAAKQDEVIDNETAVTPDGVNWSRLWGSFLSVLRHPAVWTGAVGAAIISILLWSLRGIWFEFRLIYAFRRARKRPDRLIAVLDAMWERLSRKYGRIGEQVTLREYADGVGARHERQRQAILDFVRLDEQIRYGEPAISLSVKGQLLGPWKQLIDK